MRYPVLVPNLKGLEAALAAGAEEIAVFGAASETFSQKNINCSIDESFERFPPVADAALARGHARARLRLLRARLPLRGRDRAGRGGRGRARRCSTIGCYEISLGDTIGVGTPRKTRGDAARRWRPRCRSGALAVHFHDTYGQALANVLAALELGVRVVDSSVAGLGGCPYAKGASGNVATEDVLYMLDGMGVRTGVDLDALVRARARRICHWRAGAREPEQGEALDEKARLAQACQEHGFDLLARRSGEPPTRFAP